MILLPVSEAEALDYLSILMVKECNGLPVAGRKKEIHAWLQQHGLSNAMESILFKELVRVNGNCYQAIELAMQDKISASDVQAINHQRSVLKRKIQSEFWPGTQVTEIKSGDC